ncbi:pyrroline-5-carboxylate reductase [Spirochaeta africana]|uniref:Pyrroline-5-carboxylate reductase n=1 Tax=Spirochaeta africana (strain ATCC 700263 / DSM 8902 / Z-7692) TaxID=889378 RepID=H9UK42_SPIAZ|nr:pyrroline-5-carboxylate reductase [Spirochaeta africana]AFG37885.1 pyrroline-5-carboxylate reductase [Spirochaeta africana DSM 8902]
MQRVAIFGYGNMGAAFAKALHRQFPDARFLVAEIDPGKAEAARQEIGAESLMLDAPLSDRSLSSLGKFQPELLLLAVKPFQFADLASGLRRHAGSSLVISLMAGIDLAALAEGLQTTRVVRFLPNLAAVVGQSVTAVTPHTELAVEDRTTAMTAAEAAGMAVQLPEDLISSLIGLSGSGIAFAFQFLHALALGGTQAGISYPQSLEIAIATVEGAAAALKTSGIHPADYVTRVCSPGGTTIRGVAALEQHGFTAAVMQAVHSAEQRSRELERE